jgi:hypothetical protein
LHAEDLVNFRDFLEYPPDGVVLRRRLLFRLFTAGRKLVKNAELWYPLPMSKDGKT